MAKKHFDFKPDPTGTDILSKLYITRKQRQALLKWSLFALVVLVLIILQDVIFSQLRVMGAATDLVSLALLMICILQGTEAGSMFILPAAFFYWCSGSAPGPYSIVLLTFCGVGASVFRTAYLRKSFATTLTCTALSLLVYEAGVFAIGLFLRQTVTDRWMGFLITTLLSLIAVPILYPILTSIGKIGGETWKE